MNKKIGFSVVSTLLLVTALMCVPLTFAQGTYWDYAKISAYGTNVDFFETSTSNTQRIAFTVVTPPSGSEITNMIDVMDTDSGENYTINLSVGQRVEVNYQMANPIHNSQEPAEQSEHYIIYYEGSVSGITINAVNIPEFPPILIVPLFMTATLLAILYRRKRTTQIKERID